MAPRPPTEIERELIRLESELKRLETEFNMFFSGRLAKPPWESRARVTALVKRLDQLPMQNYGDRFRFSTLQARFTTLSNLWERGMRAREEGRAGPFAQKKSEAASAEKDKKDGVLYEAAFNDPAHEPDKVHGLYDSFLEARRAVGEDEVSFDQFAKLIGEQAARLKKEGSEVAFRVAVKDGKVSLTGRVKGGSE